MLSSEKIADALSLYKRLRIKKREINSARREARNRIEYYGGKETAKAAAHQEYGYRKQQAKRKMVLGNIAGLSTSMLGIAASSQPLLATTLASGGFAYTAYNSIVNNRDYIKAGEREYMQLAYTDDFNVTNRPKARASEYDD